jgi:hypothetical protein
VSTLARERELLLVTYPNFRKRYGRIFDREDMFSHEKLHVYQRSIEWLAMSSEIVIALPKGNADLSNQLRRASLSIPLNIAEGAGKVSVPDKKRFYALKTLPALTFIAEVHVYVYVHVHVQG